jgi:hypothetical protein
MQKLQAYQWRRVLVIALGVFVGLLLWRGVDFVFAVVGSRIEAAKRAAEDERLEAMRKQGEAELAELEVALAVWGGIYDKAKEDSEGRLADRVTRQTAYKDRLSKVDLLKFQMEEIDEIRSRLSSAHKLHRDKLRYGIRETSEERAWRDDLESRQKELLNAIKK